jgi:hypothetical protein
MRKSFSLLMLVSCLLLPALPGYAEQAAEGQTAQPAAQTTAPTPAKAASPSTARSDAAEGRYRAWVDREHTQDASEFQKDKSKIEDKYKGYVRPKREKKDAKAEQTPAKGN